MSATRSSVVGGRNTDNVIGDVVPVTIAATARTVASCRAERCSRRPNLDRVRRRTVRFWAIVDSSVSYTLALPPLSTQHFISLLYTVNGKLGGDVGRARRSRRWSMFFVCLSGSLVAHLVRRALPEAERTRSHSIDGWGRVWISLLIVWFVAIEGRAARAAAVHHHRNDRRGRAVARGLSSAAAAARYVRPSVSRSDQALQSLEHRAGSGRRPFLGAVDEEHVRVALRVVADALDTVRRATSTVPPPADQVRAASVTQRIHVSSAGYPVSISALRAHQPRVDEVGRHVADHRIVVGVAADDRGAVARGPASTKASQRKLS